MHFSIGVPAIAALSAVAMASPAVAEVVVLDFEGISDEDVVGNFYAPNYIFSPDTLALIDLDAGGTGHFANEPSPNTVMFFLDVSNAILNVTNGFVDGFSFYYTSSVDAYVRVYDGFDATGNMLAQLNLSSQYQDNNCTGDPGGSYCNWTAIGVEFAGMTHSIDFSGAANSTGFDNITFGSATPGIPEPATWAMLILGFGLVGSAVRRRKAFRAGA